MLSGKQILITGVVTTDSIAFAVARRAHELGAQVLLTGFPRDLDRTRDAAEQLPGRVDVVPFDATDADDTARLADTISERWGHLDGALHAIAFASADALSGPLLDARREGIGLAFQTSTVSLAAVATVVARLAPPTGASIVASTSTPPLRGPSTTGWASARPGSNRSAATSHATSGRPASASTSSPPGRSTPERPAASPGSTRCSTPGQPARPCRGTQPTHRRSPTPPASCCPTSPRRYTRFTLPHRISGRRRTTKNDDGRSATAEPAG